MNQILLTENKNDKNKNNKYKSNNNSKDMKKIIVFFGIAILIFGLAIGGVYGYKIYNKNKDKEIVISKPEIRLEDIEKEVKVIAKSEIGISKIIYTWNEEEPKEVEQHGRTSIEEKMDIPFGESTLKVKVIDQSGQEIETIKEFSREGESEKPIIKTDIVEDAKLKITATDETAMKHIIYRWNDEEEIKVDSQTDGDKTIEVTIDVKRGENTITIEAVDIFDNTEKIDKIFKGVNKPIIEVSKNGSKLYMKMSHDMGFEKIEFSVNGQIYTYDKNFSGYDSTQKEIEYYFDLKQGENTVIIVAVSTEGTEATYKGKCDYTEE